MSLLSHCHHVAVITFTIIALLSSCCRHCVAIVLITLLSSPSHCEVGRTRGRREGEERERAIASSLLHCPHCIVVVVALALLHHEMWRTRGERRGLPHCCCHIIVIMSLSSHSPSLHCHHHVKQPIKQINCLRLSSRQHKPLTRE